MLPVKNAAAAKIQSAWRGFWQFSHYLITQFEVVRLQAFVRGYLVRNNSRLRLGCIIILQSTLRRCIAQRRTQRMKTKNHLVASTAICLRHNNASKRIQLVWKGIFQEKKERAAALTIERFFIMNQHRKEKAAALTIERFVIMNRKKKKGKAAALTIERFFIMNQKKKAIERFLIMNQRKKEKAAALMIERFVIMNQKKKEKAAALTIERFFIMVKAAVDLEILRHQQRKSSRSGHRDADDQLLEKAWEESAGASAKTHSRRELVVTTRRPVRPIEAIHVGAQEDDVSEISSPTIFYRRSRPSPRRPYTKIEHEEDTCLEEAWDDTEIHEARRQRQMEEEYLQRYGLSQKSAGRMRQHASGRESPHHRRISSGSPRVRPPHVYSEFVSPREKRRPSSRSRHIPPASPDGPFWSREDHYLNERRTPERRTPERRTPSSRTYRSPRHYEETSTMRSEFSPHSSQARPGNGSGRRKSSRERLYGYGGYDYAVDYNDDGRQRGRRHIDCSSEASAGGREYHKRIV